MIIKTKKYGLDPKIYKNIALKSVLTDWWWAFIVPIVLASIFWVHQSIWYPISAVILTVLYIAFWWIQFTGIANLEQYKMLFEKLSYEITSKQILMKLNPKQGMPMDWNSIKTASVEKDAFILKISRAQFIYLPFKVFSNQNDIRFMESILKRKGYIK
ncbi:YcxB family protein [Cyclobacteriaceae bacterium]|nr:YcxB family protein [Cyclobacteriaceae bacterium]